MINPESVLGGFTPMLEECNKDENFVKEERRYKIGCIGVWNGRVWFAKTREEMFYSGGTVATLSHFLL